MKLLLSNIKKKTKRHIKSLYRRVRSKNTNKIFVIGRNKTGTTSLEKLFKDLGFKVGNQEKGELLLEDYSKGNWKPIINYCKTAEAFQDAPFSWPYTWLILYEHYPDAKYILTTRDSEEWYNSLVNHHTKSFSSNELPPTMLDMKNALYRGKYKGRVWKSNRAVWKTPISDPYNMRIFKNNYNRHNEDVRHFFGDKQNFIAIDVSQPNDFKKLIKFLNVETSMTKFPHKNKRRSKF